MNADLRRLGRRVGVGAGVLVLVAPVCLAGPKQLNTGLYGQNYVMVESADAPWLIHPTGQFVSPADKDGLRAARAYMPGFFGTDDMDRVVREMRDKGFVLIGYAAFNTAQRPEHWTENAESMTPGEILGTKLGLKFRGIDPMADPMGDPVDAARWCNAEVVYLQKGYAFSRHQTVQKRILADEVDESTRTERRGQSGYQDTSRSDVQDTSRTAGRSRSKDDWKEAGWDVGGQVGAENTAGITTVEGSIEGGYGESWGSRRTGTDYAERTDHEAHREDQSEGVAYDDRDETVQHASRHWATALIDKEVDHFDLLATFWKRADLRKLTLGASFGPLSPDLWKAIGTKHGVVVRSVIGGSPAYLADIWEGDVLLSINGEKIAGAQAARDLLTRFRGQQVKVSLWREGKVRDISVALNTMQ